MSLDKVFVGALGLSVIVFIYWFFFKNNDKGVLAGDSIDILVDGGYKPGRIKVKKGKVTKLNFERKDKNTCLEEVFIPDFRIKKYLPLNKKVSVEIDPKKKGKFEMHCSMNMFKGEIIVE